MWLLPFLCTPLPCCVRMTTRLEERLTEFLRVKCAQNKEERALFINVTKVLPASGLVVHSTKTSSGSVGQALFPLGCQNGQNGKTAA